MIDDNTIKAAHAEIRRKRVQQWKQEYLKNLLDSFGIQAELLPQNSLLDGFALVASGGADAAVANQHGTALFEGVTGLTVDDFKLLSKLGLFNAQNMNAAIYQFKAFEDAK